MSRTDQKFVTDNLTSCLTRSVVVGVVLATV